MKRNHCGQGRNGYAHCSLACRPSAVNIGKIYQQDINGDIAVIRTAGVSAREGTKRRPTFRRDSVHDRIISRRNSWSLAIAANDRERQKELRQRASTVLNSSAYKPVVNRNNCRGFVAESRKEGRQKNVNQRASTVLNSNAYKPVVNRNSSRGLVTELRHLEAHKDRNQRASTMVSRSAYKPVIRRSHSWSLATEGGHRERQKEVLQRASAALKSSAFNTLTVPRNTVTRSAAEGQTDVRQGPTEVASGSECRSIVTRKAPEDATRHPPVERELSRLPSAVCSINVRRPASNTCHSSETVTDCASQSEREAGIVRGCQLNVNGDSKRGEERADVTRCASGFGATAFKPTCSTQRSVYDASDAVGRRVRGRVTARPLRIETARVCEVVMDSGAAQGAADGCAGWQRPRKVTQRPLVVDTGSAYQLLLNSNTSQGAADGCAHREGQTEVTQNGGVYQPVSKAVTEAGRGAETRRRPSVCHRQPCQSTLLCFLCAGTLMWVLLFCCVNKLQSVWRN
jgi:hypothetical protein